MIIFGDGMILARKQFWAARVCRSGENN